MIHEEFKKKLLKQCKTCMYYAPVKEGIESGDWKAVCTHPTYNLHGRPVDGPPDPHRHWWVSNALNRSGDGDQRICSNTKGELRGYTKSEPEKEIYW